MYFMLIPICLLNFYFNDIPLSISRMNLSNKYINFHVSRLIMDTVSVERIVEIFQNLTSKL